MATIKTKYTEEFFRNFLDPILDFSGIFVDSKGYLRNNEDETAEPYSIASSGKYPICVFNNVSLIHLNSNRETCVMFDPINNDLHSKLLLKCIKLALFNRLQEFEDDEDAEPEEIEDIITKRLILEHLVADEPGYDDFKIVVMSKNNRQRMLLHIRMVSGMTSCIKRFVFYSEILTVFNPTLYDRKRYDEIIDGEIRLVGRKYLKDFVDLINLMERERKLNFNYLKDMKQTSSEKTEVTEEGEYRSIDVTQLDEVDVKNQMDEFARQVAGSVEKVGDEFDNIDLGD